MTFALLLQVVLAAVVLFAVFAYASGWLDPMAQQPPDELHERLPVSPTRADLEQLVLPMAVRGYRMSEVDDVLDRLAQALDDKDEEIGRLQAALAAPVPVAVGGGSPSPAEQREEDGWQVPVGAATVPPVEPPVVAGADPLPTVTVPAATGGWADLAMPSVDGDPHGTTPEERGAWPS